MIKRKKEKGSFSEAHAKVKPDAFASKTDTEKPFRSSQSPKMYKPHDFSEKMADFYKVEMDDQERNKTKVGKNLI